MSKTNFRVTHTPVTSLVINSLLTSLWRHTGLRYGYHPESMDDVLISSFTGTLNDKRRISNAEAEKVELFIKGWMAGANYSVYSYYWLTQTNGPEKSVWHDSCIQY